MDQGSYSVGRAARLGGVTVRTLHHYEQVGLLVPAGRSSAGYRVYSDAEMDRLTRILYYRELGFSLHDIAALLEGTADVAQHLEQQHKLLTERAARTQAMLAAIETEMEAQMSGNRLTAEEKLEIFGDDYDPTWEDEAHERWGGTQAWQQSQNRAATRSKAEWQQIKADGDAWTEAAAGAFRDGAAPDSPQALELAERHRRMVSDHYDCSYAMHRQLADMYVADPRFTATYEKLAPGLAQWVHDAIHANADRHPDEQGQGFC